MRLRNSEDTLQLDAQQQLYVSFQSRKTITCGALDCTAHVMHFDSKTDLPVAPCCVAGSNACGLDVGPLIITNDKCQPFGQDGGMKDPTCPGCVGDTCNGGALVGCRRSDGKCGFALNDLGLGCVIDPLAP